MSAIRLVRSGNVSVLLPLLRDAEEGDDRIIAAVEDVMNSAYLALDGERRVGAAVVRWSADDSEILYVATVEELTRAAATAKRSSARCSTKRAIAASARFASGQQIQA